MQTKLADQFIALIPKFETHQTRKPTNISENMRKLLKNATVEDLVECSQQLATATNIQLNWLNYAFKVVIKRYIYCKKSLNLWEYEEFSGHTNQQKKEAAQDFLKQISVNRSKKGFSKKILDDPQLAPLKTGRLEKIITAPFERILQLHENQRTPEVALQNLQHISKINAQLVTKGNFDTTVEYGRRGVVKLPKEAQQVSKDPRKPQPIDRYYAVNMNESLGKGGFGAVYVAREINPQTGKIIANSPPLALKIFKEKAKADSPEIVEIQEKYFRNTTAFEDDKNAYLFSELLPGQNLRTFFASEQFTEFTLEQRLELIQQIMMAMNVMHHETPSTGQSLIHKDIKPENIMIDVDKSGKINVHIIDLGLIETQEERELTQKRVSKLMNISGTSQYKAPEIYCSLGGPKSDIYALSPVFMEILGAKNPIKSRSIYKRDNPDSPRSKLAEIPFDTKGLLTGAWTWDLPEVILEPLEKFVKEKMPAYRYEDRPTTDEGLRFFTELKKYVQLRELIKEENNPEAKTELKNDLKICQIKMELIANGDWEKEIRIRSVPKYKTRYEKDPETSKQKAIHDLIGEEKVHETLGHFVETHPNLAPLVSDTLKIFRDLRQLGMVSGLLEKYPQIEDDIADLGYKQLDRIEKIAESEEATKVLVQLNQAGLLNQKALAILEYAQKNDAGLMNKIKSQLPDKTHDFKLLAIAFDRVQQLGAALDDPKKQFSPDELVKISEYLFAQKDILPKSLLVTMFQKIVEKYINYKNQLDGNKKEGWFGYTNKEKKEAANELLDHMKNNGEVITPEHQSALEQGRLGDIAKRAIEIEKQKDEGPSTIMSK